MFQPVDIKYQLARLREKSRKGEDRVLFEAKRILAKDLFTEKKILGHLKQYNQSFGILDEETLDPDLIYTPAEIRRVAVMFRLKFLESKLYKSDIPYESVLRIKDLNVKTRKEIKQFHVLAHPRSFVKGGDDHAVLFTQTNYGNYYLIHRWGKKLHWARGLKVFPLRDFETLLLTILACTMVITLSLPTKLISLDPHATYWSGYRAAAFFHLLIFNLGVTAYITFAFTKNLSSSVWNRLKDFD